MEQLGHVIRSEKSSDGNIHKMSVKEIWDGYKMNEIRNEFRNNNPNKTCQLCIENEKINY